MSAQGPDDPIEVDVRITLQDYLLASYLFLFRQLWWFLTMLLLSYPALYLTAPAGSLKPTGDLASWMIFLPGAVLLFVQHFSYGQTQSEKQCRISG
jgi:hypothetical protein